MTEKEKNTIKEAMAIVKCNRHVKFNVNKKMGVVVATKIVNGEIKVGVSRCNKDDKFVKPIGEAIALLRMNKVSVPMKFLKFGE